MMQEEDLDDSCGADSSSLEESQTDLVPGSQPAFELPEDGPVLPEIFESLERAKSFESAVEHFAAITVYTDLLTKISCGDLIAPSRLHADILCKRARCWLYLGIPSSAASDLDHAEEMLGGISVHNLWLYVKANELQDRIHMAYYYAILYQALGNERTEAEKDVERIRNKVKGHFFLNALLQNHAEIKLTYRFLMDVAIKKFGKEDIREAVELFTEVVTLFEKLPDAYEYLAKCYMKLGEINKVNKNCNRALEHSKRTNKTAFAMKVDILSTKGECREALELAKEWKMIDAENDEVQALIEELEKKGRGQEVQEGKSQKLTKKSSGSAEEYQLIKRKPKSKKEQDHAEWQRQKEERKIAKELEEEKKQEDEKCKKRQENKGQELLSQPFPDCDVTATLVDDPSFQDSSGGQESREKRPNKTRRKTKNLRKVKLDPELNVNKDSALSSPNSAQGSRESATSSTKTVQSSSAVTSTETGLILHAVCNHFVRIRRREESSILSSNKVCDICRQSGAKLSAFWNRIKGEWQVIRERPGGIIGPFEICKHYNNGFPCKKTPCTFAHGEEERIAWTEGRQEGFPSVSSTKEPMPRETSRLHTWCQEFTGKHRPIQRIVPGGHYEECYWFKKRTCFFGRRCIYAHGAVELQEWKDHYAKMASQEQKKRHEERAQRKPEDKPQRTARDVISEYTRDTLVSCLDGVKVTSAPGNVSLVVPLDDVNSSHTYRCTVRLQYNSSHVGHLQEVTLVHQYHRAYRLTDISYEVPGRPAHFEDLNQLQYSFPPSLCVAGECTVKVSVGFQSNSFGCFPQCLVLNFGQESHLSLEMNVDVGPEAFVQEAMKVKNRLRFDRPIWDDSSKQVIKFEPRPPHTTDETDKLLERYQLPKRPEVIVPTPLMTDDQELNPDNYRRVMHQLLFVEEYSMRRHISRFNAENITMVTSEIVVGDNGMACAQGGELFGYFSVPSSISPDDAAGRLLLRTKGSVLLAFDQTTEGVAYESLIEKMEGDCVTVRLSAQCCKELSMRAACEVKVEAQFQINRIPLCEMHDNIDRLGPVHQRILFPTLSENKAWQQVALRWTLDPRLNEGQRKAIQAIAAPLHKLSPPLSVFGPFGTGKTYALNQAVHQIVLVRNNRVLICTHSNSAADIHVELLDHYLKQNNGLQACRPLRLYSTTRRVSTAHSRVKEYCLISNDGRFRLPTREDVVGHRVVITTLSTSRVLFDKGLNRGFFSHILIDEAAQALETETLAPLTLAGYRTKVVLTGDHMQMNPDVFSEKAIEWGFQTSLHQRLSYLYNTSDDGRIKPNLIHLTENYRSHADILQFPSDMFYGGHLISRVDQPLHPELGPLVFYSANGREEMEDTKGSYRNLAEVDEIVRRVKQLVKEWPEVWGPVDLTQICIVTPYHYQVRTIRDKLQKVNLSDVNVETVHNVQGKEFRALFISTVRTAHTCREVKRIQRSLSQDCRVYFEFLTDPKLLNTAFTRAQSVVAVVGDPYSLITMGECQRIWEEFITRCSANGKLFGVRLEDLQEELTSSGLDVNVPVFIPRETSRSDEISDASMDKNESLREEQSIKETTEIGAALDTIHMGSADGIQGISTQSTEQQISNRVSSGQAMECSPNTDVDVDVYSSSPEADSTDDNSSENEPDGEDDNERAEDQVIEFDDFMRAFKDECQRIRRRDRENDGPPAFPDANIQLSGDYGDENGAGHHGEQEMDGDDYVSVELGLPIRDKTVDDIEMVQINGRTVTRLVNLGYTRDTTPRTKRLLYHVDSPPKESLDPEYLARRLRERPDSFIKCRIRINAERYRQMYGEVQDTETEDILIERKPRQVLERDTVVIELNKEYKRLRKSERMQGNTGRDQSAIRSGASALESHLRPTKCNKEDEMETGKFVGILHHMVEPRGRQFVCSIHRENPDLMIPINKSMSLIHTTNGENGVKIYRMVKAEEISRLDCTAVVPYEKAFSGDHLFVVQYLQWRRDFPFPLGIVTKRLPKGDTISNALNILYTEYGVHKTFPERVMTDLHGKSKSDIPRKEKVERLQVGGAFTIDPPESRDLDDALTVEETSDGNLKVGIHISDVSFYVQEESELDKEAQERCTSYYPGNDLNSIPMLPQQLSEGLCSLLPDCNRLTMSIFLLLDKNGKVQGNPELCRTITHSIRRLTYGEAQNIIFQRNIKPVPTSVVESIRTLHKLAQMRRKMRLGDAALNPSEDHHEDSEAHQLVEEMMVLANQTVAKLLKEKSPESALLRTQLPPKSHRLREWREKYGRFAKYSLSLKKHISGHDKIISEDKFVILSSTWSNMVDAVGREDHRQLCHLICDERNHPQLSVAHANFHKIQMKAEYVFSGDLESDEQGAHFSMQSEYTHFTSPIRRYFDIMVHRRLLSVCNTETVDHDDKKEELATACRRCTFVSDNARKFEKECKRVHMADKLKKTSVETMAFISALDKGDIQLQIASRKEDQLTGKEKRIQVSRLGPIKQPDFNETARESQLQWKLRVYLAPDRTSGCDTTSKDEAEIKRILGLDQENNDLVHEIAGDTWKSILNLVKSGNNQGLRESILKADEAIKYRVAARSCQIPRLEGKTHHNEGRKEMQHFYTKSLRLRMGDVLMVQLASRLRRGLPTPDIQLFKLTTEMGICLEHRGNARYCFANGVTQEASKERYTSIRQYVESWSPVLAVEASRNAVETDDVFTILRLRIGWNKKSDESGFASFELSTIYCDRRHIEFSNGDFICARSVYHVTTSEESDDPPECCQANQQDDQDSVQSKANTPGTSNSTRVSTRREKRCWVGHYIVTGVDKTKEEMVRVDMKLHQNSCEIPEELFLGTVDGSDCEVIRLSVPHRRMYQTLVNGLEKQGTPLAHSICKGKPIKSDPSIVRLPSTELSIGASFKPLNTYQDAAVRRALTMPFTLIQGPPGSGKTVTGVHIAVWFANMNRPTSVMSLKTSKSNLNVEVDEDDKCRPKQVLYCGPSNKSVDVVAEYLMRVPDVKILRIYGQLLEGEAFPIPNTLRTGRRTRSKDELKVPDSLKPVSLHHVIRQEPSPFAGELARYERCFKEYQKQQNTEEELDSMIKDYLKVIADAEAWAAEGVQIVLCTCTAAGSPRIVKLCNNVAQCIVDESGMCIEPETLIPITCFKAKQIVLIGDHKQLQPIVKDDQARLLGLGKSLFERYSKKSLMLELQYRMHPAICDFPSTQFYEGKLKTDDSVNKRKPSKVDFWPARVPLVFCHVQGIEDALVVTTEEGSERSKSNEKEQKKTIFLAKMLVNRYKVKQDDVVVLSPYRAQCHNIREELNQKGFKIPVMSVVKSQGGEWDYVIISLVRSLPDREIEPQPSKRWLDENLGFLIDEHQINVALTRAKRGLCIIGNKKLLRVHEMWNNLITDYEEKHCCVDGNSWPPA